MALAEPIQGLTEAEYFEIERRAEFKSEFFDGEMFAMASGTTPHSLIATNAIGEIHALLKGRPCVVFNSDMRVKIEATGLITYPDVTVVCGPQQFAGEKEGALINPTVLVEVLSDSTEAYDRGRKFEHYRQIPSMQEYLLISQTEPHLEQFIRREAGQWLLREAVGLDATIDLPSLKITLALSDVFANVKFVPHPIRPRTPVR